MTDRANGSGGAGGAVTFRVLTVCTGNTGRSPIIEHLLQRGFEEHGAVGVVVDSAGTGAVPGSGVEPGAARALVEVGLDPSGPGAVRLAPDAVAASDLLLTATRAHSAEVLDMNPDSGQRTFTLAEFAVLSVPTRLAGHSAEHMREAVALASRRRQSQGQGLALSDDLSDPFGQADEVYQRLRDEVQAHVERIVPYLLGDTAAG